MRLLLVLVTLALVLLLLVLLKPRGAQDGSATSSRPMATVEQSATTTSSTGTTTSTANATDAARVSEDLARPDRFGLIRTPECWRDCGAPCVTDEAGSPECPPECDQDEDCGSDALCRPARPTDSPYRVWRCLSRQCEADADCGLGEACDIRSNWHTTVGLCRIAGTRNAGEPCAGDTYANHAGHCKRGLHCASGICALSRCEVDADCGVGQRCQLIANLPYRMCLPYCESDTDCAEGWACYSDDGMMARCVRRDALGCLASGCPAGHECKVRFGSGAFTMTECVQPCDADWECASGEWCARVLADDRASCRLSCASDEDCPERWWCRPATDLAGEEGLGCLPQREAHQDAFYQSFDRP